MNSILLTGTINPSVFGNTSVVLTDAKMRYNQYKETITKYIKYSDFKKVVFVENSGYEFPVKEFQELAMKYNKQFEFLFCDVDKEKTIKLGKSYGEGKLMDFGMKNSTLLENEEIVYKCTGRVYVKNINKILHKQVFGKNEFIAYNNIDYCFTLFYKVRREDYLKYFTDMSDECDESKGVAIENVLYQRIIKNNLTCSRFYRYPDFEGVCGTDGNNYGCGGIRLMIKNVLLLMGEYTVNPNKGRVMDFFFRILRMGPKYEYKRKKRAEK